jgi:hypothetical protein
VTSEGPKQDERLTREIEDRTLSMAARYRLRQMAVFPRNHAHDVEMHML